MPLVQKIRQATGAIQMGRTLLGLVIFGAGVAGFMGAGLITIPILVGVSLVVSISSKLVEVTKLPPHADESAVHHRAAQDQFQLGQAGNDVVARVEFMLSDPIELPIDRPMNLVGNSGVKNDVSVGDELAHLLVAEKNWFG